MRALYFFILQKIMSLWQVYWIILKPSDGEVIERTKVSQFLYNNHYTSLQLMERLLDI